MNTPSETTAPVTFAKGDLVEYRYTSWHPYRKYLITRAWYQHSTRDTAGVWRLEMIDSETGETMSESGHRVRKLSSAA